MKRKTKTPSCCFGLFFCFLRQGLKTGIALPTPASLSSTPKNRILPPSLNSPKPGRARSRHRTKAGAHRQDFHSRLPLSSRRHQWRCSCCTSEPKPGTLCAPRSTLELPKALFVSGTKRGLWLGSTRSASGEERRMCGASHKTFLQSDSPPVQ